MLATYLVWNWFIETLYILSIYSIFHNKSFYKITLKSSFIVIDVWLLVGVQWILCLDRFEISDRRLIAFVCLTSSFSIFRDARRVWSWVRRSDSSAWTCGWEAIWVVWQEAKRHQHKKKKLLILRSESWLTLVYRCSSYFCLLPIMSGFVLHRLPDKYV